MWLYNAFHSERAELIHLLEEYKVDPQGGKYLGSFEESIKCHHNNNANYIESNLIEEEFDDMTIYMKYLNALNYDCNSISFFFWR